MTIATAPTSAPAHFVGCDVGKTSIVMFDSRTGQTHAVPNRPADLAGFAASLDDTSLAICEATGGHEDALLQVLSKAGRAAHRADARKVKSFIRSFGTLGKTDAIDARALAAYGRERHAKLARWQTPDPQRERLQALVLKRRDLIADRQAYKNRLAAPGAAAVQRQLGKLLASFDQQIADISREMHRWPAWHRTRTRAALQMHIAAPEAGGRRSNGCCSWRRWSRQNMTRSNAVSMNDCSRRAKSHSLR